MAKSRAVVALPTFVSPAPPPPVPPAPVALPAPSPPPARYQAATESDEKGDRGRHEGWDKDGRDDYDHARDSHDRGQGRDNKDDCGTMAACDRRSSAAWAR
jgi:hypothetical protein